MVVISSMEALNSVGIYLDNRFSFNFGSRLYKCDSGNIQMAVKQKSIFLAYCAYVWTKTLLGLTFSPYKSVKETVRHPILLPVIFSPLIGIAVLLIVGKIGSLLIAVYGRERELIALFLSATLISILLWQLLLLYLLGSFLISSLRK